MKQQPRYQKGDRIGNRYLVHQALMGGMGEVYLCLDEEEMYPFALKTFQQRYLEQSQVLRYAFEQEVLVWVGLEKHPNIVRCFHMQILDNQPFMILEWIAGEEGKGANLRGWMRQGPLELKQALDFAIDICYGLVHAQQKQPGIVHRDLKPENILVAQGGLAKITDFGLAQIAVQANLEVEGLTMPEGAATTSPQQSLTAKGGVAGTPPYMPPEQWQPGAALDERADVYALGCILYEMLAGHLPFQANQPTNSYQQWLRELQQKHECALPLSLPVALPFELGELVAGCLAKDVNRRLSLAVLLTQLSSLYRDVVGQEPPERAEIGEFTAVDYNNRGVTYVNLNRPEQALSDYNRALNLNPHYAEAYNNRGNIYRAFEQPGQALSDYNRALNLNPHYAEAYNNRGNAYSDLGQLEQALVDYNKAVQLNPQADLAYYNRGLALRDLGQVEQALADYNKALQFNPQVKEVYNSRGAIYLALGQPERALADYNRALQLDPKYTLAYINRGIAYSDLGRPEQALANYNQALQLNPQATNTYINRGNTYLTLGQPKQALADYDRALQLNPKDTNAYLNRGNAYSALGQPEQALADYNRVLQLNPKDSDAYFNLGLLFAKEGQLHQSLPYIEKAGQLGHPQATQVSAQVRQMLGEPSAPISNPAQQAFEALQQATSLPAMVQAVAQYPFMVDEAFMATVGQVITQQIPPEHRPAYEQRLTWLGQIAAKQ